MNSTFLDNLRHKLQVKNDARLAERLGLHKAAVCRIRKGKANIGDSFLAKASRATDLTVEDLKALM